MAAASALKTSRRKREFAPLELVALGVPQDEAAVLAAAYQLLISCIPCQRKDAIGVAYKRAGCSQPRLCACIKQSPQ